MMQRFFSSLPLRSVWFALLWVTIGAAIFATVEHALIPWLIPDSPPPQTTLTSLMNQEARATLTHNLGLLDHIYAPDALLIDAGCQPSSQGTAFAGRDQIQARYRQFPQLTSFFHTPASVRWFPNNSSATLAEVTAGMGGSLPSLTDNASPKQVALQGNEQWMFRKVKDSWFVSGLVYNFCLPKPSEGVLTHLMAQEIQAAKNRDLQLVATIFAPDAVVTDAACQSPEQATIWAGLDRIKQRYQALPGFDQLAHVSIQITWVGDASSATTAIATATSSGVMAATDAGQKPIPLQGGELWIFTRSNVSWVISHFTYNLCLPS